MMPGKLYETHLEPSPSFGKEPLEPIVHTWMPAAALYFMDPDGNELEFLALLNDEPMELGVTPYWSEWRALQKHGY